KGSNRMESVSSVSSRNWIFESHQGLGALAGEVIGRGFGVEPRQPGGAPVLEPGFDPLLPRNRGWGSEQNQLCLQPFVGIGQRLRIMLEPHHEFADGLVPTRAMPLD